MPTGIERIAVERARQIEVEGFSDGHDEEHIEGQLSGAGIAYATLARNQIVSGHDLLTATPAQTWRWSHEAWKPSADPVRNLEKAGALIAAEIDRLLAERAERESWEATRAAIGPTSDGGPRMETRNDR
jgi:hypothetical protein